MKKTPNRWIRLAPVAVAAFAALPAMATDGYFAHGYGLRAKGMGGATIAMAQDAMGGATNPASMVWAGSRWDIGADLFSPRREAERTGAAFPSVNGSVDSGKNYFFVPELGYNQMVNPDLSAGVTVYGNGGMNTSYPQGNFNCGGGPANILCGSGGLGVDLMQLIVAPTVAYKFAPRHSVGVSLLLGYQRFKADGIQPFAAMSMQPDNVSNKGYDSSTGVGVRLGYFGQLTDRINVGAAYAPKMRMSKFDKYSGLFANGGELDIPANYDVGVAFKATPDVTLAADYQRIEYSGVPSISNPSSNMAPLGAPNGPGFGWRDVDVVKLGVSWQMNPVWTLRAGYNHSKNPITSADVSFNILAPGVMTNHYTAGFSYATTKDSEITAAFMYAPEVSVSGPSMFNSPAFMGPGNGGTETIRMHQYSFGLGWSTRF